MEAFLKLITGPASREVSEALLAMGVEVRDYADAPVHIVTEAVLEGYESYPKSVEAAIRSIPNGEAWLVGLVLPEATRCGRCQRRHKWGRENCPGAGCYSSAFWLDKECPARLAILAPEPPPLLVERVRAWGGEVWECEQDDTQSTRCAISSPFGVGWLAEEPSWPEAVRAALGEVAP